LKYKEKARNNSRFLSCSGNDFSPYDKSNLMWFNMPIASHSSGNV